MCDCCDGSDENATVCGNICLQQATANLIALNSSLAPLRFALKIREKIFSSVKKVIHSWSSSSQANPKGVNPSPISFLTHAVDSISDILRSGRYDVAYPLKLVRQRQLKNQIVTVEAMIKKETLQGPPIRRKKNRKEP